MVLSQHSEHSMDWLWKYLCLNGVDKILNFFLCKIRVFSFKTNFLLHLNRNAFFAILIQNDNNRPNQPEKSRFWHILIFNFFGKSILESFCNICLFELQNVKCLRNSAGCAEIKSSTKFQPYIWKTSRCTVSFFYLKTLVFGYFAAS